MFFPALLDENGLLCASDWPWLHSVMEVDGGSEP